MEQVDVFGVIKQMCCNIAGTAPEHFRIAFNESDDSRQLEPEADEFLKMDEHRLGRDFKVYSLMAKVSSHESALADFAYCLMQIQHTHSEVFDHIRAKVNEWASYFPEENREGWLNLWGKEEVTRD